MILMNMTVSEIEDCCECAVVKGIISLDLYSTLLFHVSLQDKVNKNVWEELIAYFPWYDANRIENVSNNSSIVACVFVTAETFLPSRCLATIGG
jgi:hypothetical protein